MWYPGGPLANLFEGAKNGRRGHGSMMIVIRTRYVPVINVHAQRVVPVAAR